MRRRKRKQLKVTEEPVAAIQQGGSFINKTVLITGAAGNIGTATATAFAREGATIVLVDLPNTLEQLNKDRQTLLLEGAQKVFVLLADASKSEEVKQMVSETLNRCGTIDCFFNNAGIQGELLPLHEQSNDEFIKTISINLTGVFLGMKYVSKAMIAAKRGGVIVNTASLAGLLGPSDMGAYAASKFGVVGLTKTGAKDLAPYGIRVCAIAPGLIEGRMWHGQVKGKALLRKKRALGSIQEEEISVSDTEIQEIEDRMMSGTPLGRLGKLSEVADVVVYLCSDKASYLTGNIVQIDGGRIQ